MRTSHTKVFATLLLLIILLPSSAFALNTASPAIRAEPALELWAHQPAVFRVEAENAASVTLHIKGAGENSYHSVAMEAAPDKQSYTATVLGKNIAPGIVEYYIEAVGENGESTRTEVFSVPSVRHKLSIDYVENPPQLWRGQGTILRTGIRGAREATLHIRPTRGGGFQALPMTYNPESRTHYAFVPGELLDAEEVEYYVTAVGHQPAERVRSAIYWVVTEVMPELPIFDEEDDTAGGEIGIQSHGSSGVFYDLLLHNYIVNGFDVSNIHNVLNPVLPGALPGGGQINSKMNQPRDEGSNPHSGLDFNVTSSFFAITKGKVMDCGPKDANGNCLRTSNVTTNAWTKVGLDYNGDQTYGDTYVWYFHLDETKDGVWRNIDTIVNKGQQLGVADPVAKHIHITWRPSSPAEQNMNQQRLWANRSELTYGFDADFITDPWWVDQRTLRVNVYALNTSDVVEGNQRPQLLWRKQGDAWNTVNMTAETCCLFKASIPAGQGWVEWYLRSKRNSLAGTPYDIYAYRPMIYSEGQAPDRYFLTYIP